MTYWNNTDIDTVVDRQAVVRLFQFGARLQAPNYVAVTNWCKTLVKSLPLMQSFCKCPNKGTHYHDFVLGLEQYCAVPKCFFGMSHGSASTLDCSAATERH